MSATLVRFTGGELEAQDKALEHLRDAQEGLSTADFEAAFLLRTKAEALAQAATVKRAEAVACEASRTRVLAERRLGELLAGVSWESGTGWATPDGELVFSSRQRGEWMMLARIPSQWFDAAICDLLGRDKSTHAVAVHNASIHLSMDAREAGIWQAWDDRFYTTVRGQFKVLDGVNISHARQSRNRIAGLEDGWEKDPAKTTLDRAHAKARQLAQSLELIAATVTGEAREEVKRAELALAEAAEHLFIAYRAAQLEAN